MRSERGFSVIELLFTGGLVTTISLMACLAYSNMMRAYTSTSVEQLVTSNLWLARQMAITQRRNITVTFQSPTNSMTLSGGQVIGSETYYLPSGYSYNAPAGAPPTPTGITTNLQGASINFLPDGSAVDPPTGNPVNGFIYLTDPAGAPTSSGLVTISGASAYIRSYTWDQGSNTWQ